MRNKSQKQILLIQNLEQLAFDLIDVILNPSFCELWSADKLLSNQQWHHFHVMVLQDIIKTLSHWGGTLASVQHSSRQRHSVCVLFTKRKPSLKRHSFCFLFWEHITILGQVQTNRPERNSEVITYCRQDLVSNSETIWEMYCIFKWRNIRFRGSKYFRQQTW